VREIAGAYLERMELLRERGDEFIGIPTGFTDLDKMLSGLNKSDLVIIAARPGMGKTALEISIALNAARRYDKRVAMFNLEMSGEQLVQRMIAAETRIDSQRLRRGELADHEWAIFLEALGRLSETRIYIDDTPSISPMQLRTKCRRLYAEHGLDLVMIDYLQLMQAEHPTSNRVQEVSEISRELKGLARELDVPVLAAAQLSRAVESRQNKRPHAVGPARLRIVSSRTRTWSCSSIATTTIIRTVPSGRTSPRSTWPSTATARPARSTSSGTASWRRSATCTGRRSNCSG
jgi:replicative DNA helicase